MPILWLYILLRSDLYDVFNMFNANMKPELLLILMEHGRVQTLWEYRLVKSLQLVVSELKFTTMCVVQPILTFQTIIDYLISEHALQDYDF